jgi:PKHD-type hydroxylase
MPIHDCPTAFSDSECDRIIALAASGPVIPATVYGDSYRVDRSVRDVATAYRARDESTAWIYDRLDRLFAEAGETLGLRVGPMTEDIQIARYDPGCHFIQWHTDSGADVHAERLISVSVELSDPGDYDGGLLEIVPETVGRPRSLPRGGARFFPSRALHRVTPVTRGTRYSLVNWTGPPT